MLTDQADNLRRLAARSHSGDRQPRGRLTVLSGCKGGVGVTTLSLNLAVAALEQMPRVLLIDCNPIRGDLAVTYRIQAEHDIDSLIKGRCSIQEAITSGPAGLQVIARFGRRESMPAASCWQLLRHLDEVNHDFDQVIIDAGSSPAVAEVLWPAADEAAVVTTTDQVALTDSYALVKSMQSRNVAMNRIGFTVNRHRSEERAVDVQQRLIRSCKQFLDLRAVPFGVVPHDDYWELAVNELRSISCARPVSASALAIQDIARQLSPGHVDTNHLNPVAAR